MGLNEKLIKKLNNKYSISIDGIVKNIKTGKTIKNKLGTRGYIKVNITVAKGITKSFDIHRLLAKYYIDNPYNLPIVHHKDHNKTNYSISNLEWTTSSQNCKYSNKFYNKNKTKKYTINQIKEAINLYSDKEDIIDYLINL